MPFNDNAKSILKARRACLGDTGCCTAVRITASPQSNVGWNTESRGRSLGLFIEQRDSNGVSPPARCGGTTSTKLYRNFHDRVLVRGGGGNWPWGVGDDTGGCFGAGDTQGGLDPTGLIRQDPSAARQECPEDVGARWEICPFTWQCWGVAGNGAFDTQVECGEPPSSSFPFSSSCAILWCPLPCPGSSLCMATLTVL